MINKMYSDNFKKETLLLFINSKVFKQFIENKWYSICNLGNEIYKVNIYEVE